MRFVHLGDTHLGCMNYKIPERKQDFVDAFSQVIDYSINNKVDFVIHSGDLFDSAKPDNETIIKTIEELKKLKQAGIPLFIVPGSHDIGVGGTFITVLEKVGLLKNLGSPSYYEAVDENILVKGEVYKDAFICGLPGRRSRIEEVYSTIIPDIPNDKFSIFIFHHIVSSVKDAHFFADIPISLLPRGFNYYAGGHWHSREEFEHLNGRVVYPGSTERASSNEMNNIPGFYDYKDGRLEFIRLKVREAQTLDINSNNLSPDEINEEIIKNIQEASNKPLLLINLSGKLKEGNKTMINRESIHEKAVSKGYLHAKINMNNLENSESRIHLQTGKKTIQEIEDEYLSKQGYEKEEVKQAKILIKELGVKLTAKELDDKVQRIISESI